MAPKKQTIIYNGALSKGGTNTNTGGTVPPYPANRERATDDVGSSFQRIATSAQLPLFEGQLLQMLVDMKEQIEQQARSDRDREQETLDARTPFVNRRR